MRLLTLFLVLISSPSSLYFQQKVGASVSMPQPIAIMDDTTTCHNTSVGTDQPWLWVSANNFSCTDRTPLAAWVDTTGLVPGMYKGVIMVNDLKIPVTLEVIP